MNGTHCFLAIGLLCNVACSFTLARTLGRVVILLRLV